MNRRRIIIGILLIPFFLLGLAPNQVFARLDEGGGSRTYDANTVSPSISFQYLTVTQKQVEQSSNAAPGHVQDQKKTNGHIKIKVAYDQAGEARPITDIESISISGQNVFSKDERTYGKSYHYDGDGNIVIATQKGLNTEKGLVCTIRVARGTSLEDFNSSMQSCAESMDKWIGPSETNGATYTYNDFGRITFTNIDGQKTILNEEGKSLGENAEDAGLNADTPAEAAEQAGSGNSSDACYDNAGPLGWVLCPVIQMAASFSNWFYDTLVEPQLEIQASGIFETEGGVYQVWSGFRDIANVAFAILFLVVIFSQLTGYGIDNYGIKRMLPRIIIAAILINLSYFICQLAVDLANIIGVSIGNFFNSFTSEYALGDVNRSSPNVAQYIFAFAGGAAIGVASYFAFGPGIIITILISAVSVLISLITLFAILTARQAAVIILIVISPLALVCYLLPNTENLTKKWLKIAEAMLLLYPICSLVIAAGALAGSVMAGVAGDDDVGMAIAAMLLNVVPYLAIPSLVKNSMAGLGNLGARISNLGQRAQRATANLKNSEMVKDAKASLNAKSNNANGLRAKVLGKTAIGRRIMGRQNSEAAKRKQARNKAEMMGKPGWSAMIDKNLDDENRRESAKILQSTYDDLSGSDLQKQFVDSMGDEDAYRDGKIDALVNTYMDNGDYDGLDRALKAAGANGADSKMMEHARDAMKANRNFGELSAKRPSLGEWAKGPIDDRHDIADSMYNSVGSFKPKDWASMNGEERNEAFRTLDVMKRLGDAGDTYAATNYEEAIRSMRLAANDPNLRGNMTPEVIKAYNDYAGPAPAPNISSVSGKRLAQMSEQDFNNFVEQYAGSNSVELKDLASQALSYADTNAQDVSPVMRSALNSIVNGPGQTSPEPVPEVPEINDISGKNLAQMSEQDFNNFVEQYAGSNPNELRALAKDASKYAKKNPADVNPTMREALKTMKKGTSS